MLNRRVKRFDKEQAFQKLKHFCGYQQRCHQEAKEKLYAFGLHKQEVEELLSRLIEENYLNEEGFAIAYAGGKFRMKGWGKIKIRYALKEKRVSDYCIRTALNAIDENQYRDVLNKTAKVKWKALSSEPNAFVKMRKTQDYLIQKGFELNLVSQTIQQLRKASREGAEEIVDDKK